MKKCKTCGASLDDSAAFCVMCGTKQDDGVQTDLQAPPTASQINYDTVATNEQPKLSPREMFFKATSSTKALVAVILIVVSFVISCISVVGNIFLITSGQFWQQIMAQLPDVAVDEAILNIGLNITSIILCATLILALIPSTFSMVGILLTYLNSKNRGLDTKGLTFLKVSNIIMLVMYGLVALTLIFAFFAIPGGIIIAIICCAIALALPVLVQIFFITTIDKMKNVVKHDMNLSIPTFVPIIIIIFCGYLALMGLTSGNILSIAIGLINIVGNILYAICMFDYNNSIALMRVKNMYNTPTDRGNGL